MQHEYKMEPAQRRPGRIRGIRSPNTRLAIGLTDQLNAAAEDGWEYVRTDSFPVEFRSGLFRTQGCRNCVLFGVPAADRQ